MEPYSNKRGMSCCMPALSKLTVVMLLFQANHLIQDEETYKILYYRLGSNFLARNQNLNNTLSLER